MAKTKVKFSYTDGRKVTRQGPAAVFNLLLPIELRIPPMGEVRVGLGVSCDHPVQVFESKGLKSRGVFLKNVDIFDADEVISVTVMNPSTEPQMIEIGEVLARCAVIDNSRIVEE